MNLYDFHDLKESIRIEGKRAETALPKSIWETYSAFANTMGGDIILGVEEDESGFLIPVGVMDVEGILKSLWSTLNNKQKVNINILTDDDVEIKNIDNKNLIIIHVPIAPRETKPIYINQNIQSGTYRRNGDGDYHCTMLEIKNMLRDQSEQTQDYKIVDRFSIKDINVDTLAAYRKLFKTQYPNHPWIHLDDQEFLYRINGIDKDKSGEFHLTEAGLFMFSYDFEIEKVFPDYFLDYREMMDPKVRWTNRIHSGEGSWSGNLFDFFFLVMPYLSTAFGKRFELESSTRRKDEPDIVTALREALVNCICNANFYDAYGLVIKHYPDKFVFENPGVLRIPIEKALIGGDSNPRNKAIMKMFSLIGYGERAGSGIPDIFSIWEKEHFPLPEYEQQFNHDRTILTLQFIPQMSHTAFDFSTQPSHLKVYQYMLEHDTVKTKDIVNLLDVKEARARQILKEMTEQNLILALGEKRNRVYKIKG